MNEKLCYLTLGLDDSGGQTLFGVVDVLGLGALSAENLVQSGKYGYS